MAGETERSPEGTEERQTPYTEVCTTLPQRGLPPHKVLSHKHFLLKSSIETMVLRPASLPRKAKLVEPEPDPETHLAGAPAPSDDLLRELLSRLASGILRAASSCPEAEDRQGTADQAALKTSEEVASLPVALRFQEETERSARWRPLHPETPAGLAERSPGGTEERQAPCNEVYTALPQRGPVLKSHGP